jgi:hypothetical protein
MSRRLVYCEGQDDVTALRGIVKRAFKVSWKQDDDFPNARRSARFELGQGNVLSMVALRPDPARGSTPNRESAIQLARQDFVDGAAPDRPRIGLCVDPDTDSLEALRAAVRARLPAEAVDTDLGWTLDGRELLLLPWHVESVLFNRLPELQNLERLAIDAIRRCDPDGAGLVERWIGELGEKRGDKFRSWKAALLLFHAATEPKTTEDSFFDEIFSDREDTSLDAIAALKMRPFWRALERLIAA